MPPHPRPYALYVVSVRQARCLSRASFRFYLAIDTLASDYTLPAIRARLGLSPIRIRSCWTNKKLGHEQAQSLIEKYSNGALFRSLIHIHKPTGKCPASLEWLITTFNQQHLRFYFFRYNNAVSRYSWSWIFISVCHIFITHVTLA